MGPENKETLRYNEVEIDFRAFFNWAHNCLRTLRSSGKDRMATLCKGSQAKNEQCQWEWVNSEQGVWASSAVFEVGKNCM